MFFIITKYKNISNKVDGPYSQQGRRLTIRPPGIPEKPQHALIGGLFGGYIIWGNYTSINYQIVLYLTSRVLIGLSTLLREKNIPPFCYGKGGKKHVYPFHAAIVWGIVMILYEANPEVLHPSLKKSMDEIYRMNPNVSFFKREEGNGGKFLKKIMSILMGRKVE